VEAVCRVEGGWRVVEVIVAYVDRFGRQRELPAARVRRVRFEELSALKVPVAYPGRSSFVTHAWASATGQRLDCASLRQQQVGMLLDRDLDVALRSAGPLELRWHDDRGRAARLRPAFVAWRRERREVICIPPEEPDGRWRAGQAVLAHAAAQADWHVRVLAPPTGVELDNLQLLYAARDPRGRDPQQARRLVQAFTAPRPIRAAVRAAGLPRLTGIDLAYHLIWQHRLCIDAGRQLTSTSTAWTAPVQEAP
jgi:hypothetical protein